MCTKGIHLGVLIDILNRYPRSTPSWHSIDTTSTSLSTVSRELTNFQLIDMSQLIECWPSTNWDVDRVSIEMSIKSIDRQSTTDAFSAHEYGLVESVQQLKPTQNADLLGFTFRWTWICYGSRCIPFRQLMDAIEEQSTSAIKLQIQDVPIRKHHVDDTYRENFYMYCLT